MLTLKNWNRKNNGVKIAFKFIPIFITGAIGLSKIYVPWDSQVTRNVFNVSSTALYISSPDRFEV